MHWSQKYVDAFWACFWSLAEAVYSLCRLTSHTWTGNRLDMSHTPIQPTWTTCWRWTSYLSGGHDGGLLALPLVCRALGCRVGGACRRGWAGWTGGSCGFRLRQMDTDQISGHDAAGRQSLSSVREQLGAVQRQTKLCVWTEAQVGSQITETLLTTTQITELDVCSTDLSPCEDNSISWMWSLSSFKLGSSPSNSTRLVCLLIRTRSFMILLTHTDTGRGLTLSNAQTADGHDALNRTEFTCLDFISLSLIFHIILFPCCI